MWHASIAVVARSGDRVIPIADLTRGVRRVAEAYARDLLDGVGAGPLIENHGELALHCRRSLADTEIRGLDPAWLAIEPVDMG